MTDLTTTYLGLPLRCPLVASSSPATGDLEGLRHLDEAGIGAVVLPSLFEEQIVQEALEVDRMLATGAEAFAEATDYFPELDDYNTGPDHYLARVVEAKAALSVPVIASLNAVSSGGWVRYGRLLADAGADALELNVNIVATDPVLSAAEVEALLLTTVGDVLDAVDIPVALKLGPFWSSLPHLARRLAETGVRGLVLFNRPFAPDLDLEELVVVPHLTLSEPDDILLPLRWIGLLEGQVDTDLAATSGVHDASSVAKVLLAGAQVAMMATALLRNGPGHAAVVLDELRAWMAENDYASVDQLRGSASRRGVADPAAYERSNYLQTLTSYSSTFPT
ncbi:MAG TPA: dihydroorotate dehydrogenase-like protein [Acidimicrobiales bacterium]